MDDAAREKIQVEIDQELKQIIPDYLESRRSDCAEVKRLLARGDMASIQILAHRMKGSGGSFGFDEISAIGEALERASQLANMEGIKSAVERLERYLAGVSVIYS